MALGLLRPVGRVIGVLCGGSTPHQIALGLTLGVVLGLVPKGNLTAVLLCGLILVLRVNLSAATAATFLAMGFAPALEGVAHQFGLTALSARPLYGFWTWLFAQPLAPWLRLENTVVLGQLLLGLAAAGPIYGVSQALIARVQPGVVAVMSRSSLARLALGVRRPVERSAA